MLDVAPTELLLVAVVAVIVIGPKDLPRAMRMVGQWVGRARGVARQFRQGFDDMVREAEFKEMEKKWAEENARIMREFPSTEAPTPALPGPPAVAGEGEGAPATLTVMPDLDEPTPTVGAAPEAPPLVKPVRKRTPRKSSAGAATAAASPEPRAKPRRTAKP